MMQCLRWADSMMWLAWCQTGHCQSPLFGLQGRYAVQVDWVISTYPLTYLLALPYGLSQQRVLSSEASTSGTDHFNPSDK